MTQICKNCGYEGKPKQGYFNVCPNCLFNSIIDHIDERMKDIHAKQEFKTNFRGDGSVGISGSIQIRDKQSAIFLVQGIIEQFDIERDDLDI